MDFQTFLLIKLDYEYVCLQIIELAISGMPRNKLPVFGCCDTRGFTANHKYIQNFPPAVSKNLIFEHFRTNWSNLILADLVFFVLKSTPSDIR